MNILSHTTMNHFAVSPANNHVNSITNVTPTKIKRTMEIVNKICSHKYLSDEAYYTNLLALDLENDVSKKRTKVILKIDT